MDSIHCHGGIRLAGLIARDGVEGRHLIIIGGSHFLIHIAHKWRKRRAYQFIVLPVGGTIHIILNGLDVRPCPNHVGHGDIIDTQGTQNLLHDNQKPAFAKILKGGMMSQDIFVEVGHGPTLIDHNILLSEATLRLATQGVAMVHNLICGALTCVGGGTGPRYTPYHMPHCTEVMGFMTILHGDDRFYNNIFVQKWPAEDVTVMSDSEENKSFSENREVGTHVMNDYPTYDEWIAQFDMDTDVPNMAKLAPAHEGKLPVWVDGNAYFAGAKACVHETRNLVDDKSEVYVELEEKDGHPVLRTNVYDLLGSFRASMISSDTLGRAFEPEERYEQPDGTDIVFNSDYFGAHRGIDVLPGPFACGKDADKPLW